MFVRLTCRHGATSIELRMAEGPVAKQVATLVAGGELAEAVALLRASYDDSVRAFVARRMRGVAGAVQEDICQEVWLAALEGLGGFHGASDPGTWLLTIARNKAADYFRDRDRRRVEPIEAAISKLVVSSAKGPSRWAAAQEQRALVRQWVEELDSSTRVLVVWRYYEGCLPSQWLDRIRREGCAATHGIEEDLAKLDAATGHERAEIEKTLKDRLMKRLGRAVHQILDRLEALEVTKAPDHGG
jgi:RNA polymerase sigma factor (sigma-70 family)